MGNRAIKLIYSKIKRIYMSKKEKSKLPSPPDIEKLKAVYKEPERSLGDYLLEKEFERNKVTEELLANHKSKQGKSKQN